MFEIAPADALLIPLRVLLVYVTCMLLLRVSGRREMAQLSPMDLLLMLLVSETVSPSLTGNDESITAGLIAVTTLFGLWALTSRLVASRQSIERAVQGEAFVLITDGHVRGDVLRRFRISSDDLAAALHQHGVLSVGDIARAYVEADGEITMIKRDDHEKSLARHHHRQSSAGP